MPDRAVKTELFDQFARVAQALGSGRRVEIVDVLANGERAGVRDTGVLDPRTQAAMSSAGFSR